jgi:2-methylcitrate dehydratase PrpD
MQDGASSIGQRLASAIQHGAQPKLDDAVRAKLRLCLMDFLACALEARNLPWSRQAAALADGPGACTIVGTSLRVQPTDACFANAVAGHGLVREDMHAGSVSHLGVAVLPAVLAVAEDRGLSGADVVEAAVLGYEVGARLGAAIITPDFTRLFRPTGFTGPIAAAAALCNLLRLDEGQTASALALAANMTGGLNQWPYAGTDEMFFHPGQAAASALRAVRLAAAGANGSSLAFDGEAGFLRAHRPDRQAPDITLFDGSRPEVMSVYLKPLPVCNFAQTPCQAALLLAREEQVEPERIRSIKVRVTAAALRYPGCAHAGPFERVLQAKMSIPYAVAAALLQRAVTEASYADLYDPLLARLAQAVILEDDAALTAAFPAAQGAAVSVTLDDGRTLTRALADVTAADEALVRARFIDTATRFADQASATAMVATIDAIESLPDAGALMRLFSVPRPADA